MYVFVERTSFSVSSFWTHQQRYTSLDSAPFVLANGARRLLRALLGVPVKVGVDPLDHALPEGRDGVGLLHLLPAGRAGHHVNHRTQVPSVCFGCGKQIPIFLRTRHNRTSLLRGSRIGFKLGEEILVVVVGHIVSFEGTLDKLYCLSSDNRIAPFVKFVKKRLIK